MFHYFLFSAQTILNLWWGCGDVGVGWGILLWAWPQGSRAGVGWWWGGGVRLMFGDDHRAEKWRTVGRVQNATLECYNIIYTTLNCKEIVRQLYLHIKGTCKSHYIRNSPWNIISGIVDIDLPQILYSPSSKSKKCSLMSKGLGFCTTNSVSVINSVTTSSITDYYDRLFCSKFSICRITNWIQCHWPMRT